MSELVYGYLLHVNGQKVQEVFHEFRDAVEAARPHMDMAKMAVLRIQSTSDVPVKTWNYDYGLSTWVRLSLVWLKPINLDRHLNINQWLRSMSSSSETVAMSPGDSVTDRILEIVALAPGCRMKHIAHLLPDLTLREVFNTLRYLSTNGQLKLTVDGQEGVTITVSPRSFN
jgi:hypothetical protein